LKGKFEKEKIVIPIVLALLISFIVGIYVFDISKKGLTNTIDDTTEEISQEIKDKLEIKAYAIVDELRKSVNKIDTTNVNFKFLGCFDEDDLYEVCYIIYENEEITGCQLKIYYSKDNYKLAKASYIYNSLEVSVGKVIDKMTNTYILGNLPYSIDPLAFYNKTGSDIVSMYEKMYENNYTFSSGYKISVDALSNNLYTYNFQKID